MICPSCRAENPEGARYCNECGMPLSGMIAQMAAVVDGPLAAREDEIEKRRDEQAQAPDGMPDLPSIDVVGVNVDEQGRAFEEEACLDQLSDDHEEIPYDVPADPFGTASFEFDDLTQDYRPASSPESTLEMPRVEREEPTPSLIYHAPEGPSTPRPRHRGRVVAVACVLAVALVAAGVAGAYSLELWGGKTVPDVVGRTQTDAVSMLEEKGFGVTVTQVKSDETEGVVLEESPSAGGRADAGSQVEISVATRRVVPDVVGATLKEAKQLLGDEGVVDVEVVEEETDAAEGTVLAVEPAVGTFVTQDTTVVLTVACAYAVPDVVGETAEDAQEQLLDKGYEVEVAYVYYEDDEDVEEGTVLSTEPETGEALELGETVVLNVAASWSAQLEQTSLDYLSGLDTIELSDVTYRISNVDGVTYKGENTIAFTITARAVGTLDGETVMTSERQVNGTILFTDDGDIASVF